MKILDKIWFTNQLGTVGIIIIEDNTKIKAYIGVVPRASESADTQYLIDYGNCLPLDIFNRWQMLARKGKGNHGS